MRKVVLVCALSAAIAVMLAGSQYLNRGSASEGAQGMVILMRHADATTGRDSPDNLKLDDCATQRNLNDNGRRQAVRLGQYFRTGGAVIGKIIASPMCRASETARLLDIGPVELSRDFVDLTNNKAIADQLLGKQRDIIARWRGPGALIIVTHGSNIRALTTVDLDPAEMLVVDSTSRRWRLVSFSE